MDTSTLLIGVLAGAIGAGYLVYWKHQQMGVPMICGIALSLYPYFTSSLWALWWIGIALILAPFFLRF